MNIVTITDFNGGLNNQKIALAGCFVIANRIGAKVKLPFYFSNFTPTVEGLKREKLYFSDIFDIDVFLSAIPPSMIANRDADVDTVLSWRDCFEKGGEALNDLDETAIIVLANLVATQNLQIISNMILDWLIPKQPFGLQLRIERDWQEYLIKKFGNINVLRENEEITVDIDRIFGKCSKTDGLKNRKNIWCCSDEDDLLLSKDHIRAHAEQYGFNLFFKSDLPKSINIPLERTKRSVIDFSVCMGLKAYVGTTRSTFSNQLFLMRQYGKCAEDAIHYVFNNAGDSCLLRKN
jgi:hypothetical protein